MILSKTSATKTIIYFIAVFFVAFSCWTSHFFGNVTFDQIYFTIKFGVHSVVTSDRVFRKYFIIWCGLYTILITIAIMLIERWIFTPSKRFIKPRPLVFLLQHIHFLFLFAALIYAGQQLHYFEYLQRKFAYDAKTDFFRLNYVDPSQVQLHASRPKNLVLIYIEGLEKTYSDAELFGRDLLKPFEQFKQSSISFTNYEQMPGTGWTMAALTSTQCAVPLKTVSVFEGNRQGSNVKHFLQNATCLGDVLAKHGYKNVFFGGASLHFSGKGKFFNDHHYEEIYGLNYWHTHGVTDTSPWGLYDDDLLTRAKSRLIELVNSKQLFNLTILTVDTHGPAGHLSKTCKKKGVNDFEGIVECTSQEVADFVGFIVQKGWLDRITVVIVGDHLAMQNSVYEKLLSRNRTVFNMIISNENIKKTRENIVHFDMLPTILNAIGFHSDTDRLGLGYSAISTVTTPPNDRVQNLQKNVLNESPVYNNLW